MKLAELYTYSKRMVNYDGHSKYTLIALTSAMGTLGYSATANLIMHDTSIDVGKPSSTIEQVLILIAYFEKQIAVIFHTTITAN